VFFVDGVAPNNIIAAVVAAVVNKTSMKNMWTGVHSFFVTRFYVTTFFYYDMVLLYLVCLL
jgi:hypothetical protein